MRRGGGGGGYALAFIVLGIRSEKEIYNDISTGMHNAYQAPLVAWRLASSSSPGQIRAQTLLLSCEPCPLGFISAFSDGLKRTSTE